jgi:RND family efflux transporter MFP subunit
MEPRPDTRALLDQLRIDRTAQPKRRHRSVGLALVLVLLGVVAATAWLVLRPSRPDVEPRVTETPIPLTQVITPAPRAPANDSVLDATGYVIARRQATVSAQVTGQVIEVYVEEGQTVAAGDVLARLDDAIPRAQRDLVAAQLAAQRAAASELDAQYAQAERDLARTRNLASRNLASAADLERDVLALDALAARRGVVARQVQVAEKSLALQDRALDDMTVRAPFAGVVVAKAAQPGEIISPISAGGGFTRTGICTIVDMDSLEVEVDVNEAYINRVSADQPVAVTLNAYPDAPYAARVIAIIPTADRNKATVKVRIRLLERDARVLPDMGVRVAFQAPGAVAKDT